MIIDQDIRRLDVAVFHFAQMDVTQRLDQRPDDFAQSLIWRDRPPLVQNFIQRSLDPIEHYVHSAGFVEPGIPVANDPGVFELLQRPHFALEDLLRRVVGKQSLDDLYCDDLGCLNVDALIDGGLPAAAGFFPLDWEVAPSDVVIVDDQLDLL